MEPQAKVQTNNCKHNTNAIMKRRAPRQGKWPRLTGNALSGSFRFTAADYARLEASKRAARARAEGEATMKTAAMRQSELDQKEQGRAGRVGDVAVVRVRFADQTQLEAEFQAREPISALHHLLTRCEFASSLLRFCQPEWSPR